MSLRVRVLAALLVATVLSVVGATAAIADVAAPRLAVQGRELVDTSTAPATPVQLRGVNRSGTEYACASGADPARPGTGGYAIFDGPTYDSAGDSTGTGADVQASVDAMRRWGVNAVRIPLSDACWFGDRALNPAYSGQAYQRAIVDYVDLLARNGIVAILSLHVASTTQGGIVAPNLGLRLLPMPDATRGPEFWRSVVQQLANGRPSAAPRTSVVLDLFNEPHLDARDGIDPASGWDCWRDGCQVNTVDPPSDPPATTDPTPAYRTAGVQQLVAAVRSQERDTGSPARPLLLGGLDYANDLSGWTAHLPLTPDGRGGTGIDPGLVASFHAYGGRLNADGSVARHGTRCTDESCWDRTLGGVLRDGRPVVTGEIGQYDCRSDLTRRFATWADAQGGTDAGGVSYLAWTWNAMRKGTPAAPGVASGWACDDGPSLIRFNDGTPTDAYGLGYCQWLRDRAGLPAGGPSNPCPAARVASEPPADATPVPSPPADPAPTTPTPTQPTASGPAPAWGSGGGAPAGDAGSSAGTVLPGAGAAVPAAATPPASRPGEPRGVRLTARTARVRGGRLVLPVSCAAGRTRCVGRITVRTASKVRVGRRRAALVVARVPFDVSAGRSATLSVAPTADGRRLLRRTRRLPTVATVTSTGDLPGVSRLTLSR